MLIYGRRNCDASKDSIWGSLDPYWNHITSKWSTKLWGFGTQEIYEGVNFYADIGGTQPLYSGVKSTVDLNAPLYHYDYISSNSTSELTSLYETNYLRSSGNGLAIQCWYNPSTIDHINTTWENLSRSEYYYEGILGYEQVAHSTAEICFEIHFMFAMKTKILLLFVAALCLVFHAQATTPMYRLLVKTNSFSPYYNHTTTDTISDYSGAYDVIYEGVNFYSNIGGSVLLREGYNYAFKYNGPYPPNPPPTPYPDYTSSTSSSELSHVTGICYINNTGSLAIQRWFNSSIVDHVNTTWENLSSSGYYYEGNLGYE